jgi:hypothetical protein
MGHGLGQMQSRIMTELQSRPSDVHDYRRISKDLARRHGGISHRNRNLTSPAWQSSFSRAWHRLIARGLIEHVRDLPDDGPQSGRRFVRISVSEAQPISK